MSSEFAGKVGKSTQPPFPLGVGARGSSGVAGVVENTPGAIGYADVAYALANKLRFAKVKNKAGRVRDARHPRGSRCGRDRSRPFLRTTPSRSSIHRRARGKLAYPISTFTWVIVPLEAKNAKPVKQFLLFAISKTGQALGTKLLYAPIPDSVRVAAAKSIAKVKQAAETSDRVDRSAGRRAVGRRTATGGHGRTRRTDGGGR